jgi:hypothetical protein
VEGTLGEMRRRGRRWVGRVRRGGAGRGGARAEILRTSCGHGAAAGGGWGGAEESGGGEVGETAHTTVRRAWQGGEVIAWAETMACTPPMHALRRGVGWNLVGEGEEGGWRRVGP